MAIKLNLLPPEKAVDKNLSQVLRMVRALGVIALAIFLITVVGLGAYFIYSNFSLNNLNTQNTQLKSQIAQQETSEQQIILLKDRLKKISTAQNSPSALKNLIALDPVLTSFSGDLQINELSIDSTKVGFSATFKSNTALSSFFEGISKIPEFKTVVLSSFGFNPTTGYAAGITMTNK